MPNSLRTLLVITLSLLATLGTLGAVLAAPIEPAAPNGVGSPAIIAATAADSQRPQLAHGNAITHAVWAEAGWIVHSRNTGLSWTAPISVAVGDDPALAVDSTGQLHLAFTTLISGTLNVYHSRYSGSTWSAPLQVSDGLANTSAPDIAVAPDNTLAVVWSQGQAKQLHLAGSSNGGQTWPDLAPIFAANGSAPKIAIGTGNVLHVVWQDDTAVPFRIKHLQRASLTWSLIDVLSADTTSAFSPDVFAGTEAHLVWQQAAAILYTRGSHLNFSAPITLSTGTASAPAIHAAGNGVAAAWDAGTSIGLRVNPTGTWNSLAILGTQAAGVGQPIVLGGPNGVVYGAFTWGASGTRDIAFNIYTPDAAPAAPATPLLIAPLNGAAVSGDPAATTAVNLHWQAGNDVTGYNVNVDGNIITTTGVTSITQLALGTHTWTVRAYNDAGYSAWAAPWSFTLVPPRLSLPLIVH